MRHEGCKYQYQYQHWADASAFGCPERRICRGKVTDRHVAHAFCRRRHLRADLKVSNLDSRFDLQDREQKSRCPILISGSAWQGCTIEVRCVDVRSSRLTFRSLATLSSQLGERKVEPATWHNVLSCRDSCGCSGCSSRDQNISEAQRLPKTAGINR